MILYIYYQYLINQKKHEFRQTFIIIAENINQNRLLYVNK